MRRPVIAQWRRPVALDIVIRDFTGMLISTGIGGTLFVTAFRGKGNTSGKHSGNTH